MWSGKDIKSLPVIATLQITRRACFVAGHGRTEINDLTSVNILVAREDTHRQQNVIIKYPLPLP